MAIDLTRSLYRMTDLHLFTFKSIFKWFEHGRMIYTRLSIIYVVRHVTNSHYELMRRL